jgi:phytoene dehydrogenase-like protein
MARVVVIGGGFGGLAAAARLAKLGHHVTVVEQAAEPGGALRPVLAQGYRWDAAATYCLLPAVIRDLFRKSGRPVERELELLNLPVIREHRFTDHSSVQVPGGSRAEQLRAFDQLGAGLGQQWCTYVASYADDWELIRREYLERPWSPKIASRELTSRLLTRENLHRRINKELKDKRLRLVAGFPHDYGGHDLRLVPGWLGATAYIEQAFGAWTIAGGMSKLAEALTARLVTRQVQVVTDTTANDLIVRQGRASAVVTTQGAIDADVVVIAIDPRRLPTMAVHVAGTTPVVPPHTTYLGLVGELAPETVFHGSPTLVLRTALHASRTPPPHTSDAHTSGGSHAWTLQSFGQYAGDPLNTLLRHGIDLCGQITVRIDRSPNELLDEWGGSPGGLRWQGRETINARLGPRTPITGVYAVGAHATPGAGLPFVGLSAALVAHVVGPA